MLIRQVSTVGLMSKTPGFGSVGRGELDEVSWEGRVIESGRSGVLWRYIEYTPQWAPIAEGESEYTSSGHQSQKGREYLRAALFH
eukprot:7588106-Pyramimonas_sp.AAC.1